MSDEIKCKSCGDLCVLRERDELKAELDELQSSIASLEELHAVPGKMELHIKEHPHLARYISRCFAELVASSPNYTECRFDRVVETDAEPEFITVHIQKQSGKTPHQLRVEAEKERDALRAQFEEASKAYAQMRDAGEMLWAVVANVGGGNWSEEPEAWRIAAAKWRDNYHEVCAKARVP